jgi:hypothetical protein
VPQHHWQNQVFTNQFLSAILAEEKCEQAGVEIAYYEFPQIHRLYVHGADSTNSRTVTKANLIGRKTILERVRKEGSRLMHLQPEIGFRESYRIEGETVITVNDYRDGRVFDDAVSYAFYPVDLHTRAGVRPEPLPHGKVPTVPLRALIPKDSCTRIPASFMAFMAP